MDRGRVGYDLVGNKTIRENALKHKRNCHLERLKKIKSRTAGSSKTLDNNTPESLLNQMIQKNPRKLKIKEDTAVTIQRENRALLQRISLILTAPPKITDADYQKLKKLGARDKMKEKFEKALDEKRNEEIFDRIKKTDAYYHHKQWEDDYARQKAGQKFMRQVTYKRPKGFVDPFAPPPREEEDDDDGDLDEAAMEELLRDGGGEGAPSQGGRTPGKKSSKRGVSTSKSSGHLNSVRTLRDRAGTAPQSADAATNRRSKTSPSKLERGGSRQKESFARSGSGDSQGSGGGAADSGLCAEAEAVNKNAPLLLAHVHRHTPLQDGRLEVDRKLPNTDILTDIQCWRKIVQSDEIRENTAAKQLENDFDDDGDSIGSAGSYQMAPPERKKETKRPVAIITVRAEILDFSERDTIVLLSVEKLLQSWRVHKGDNDRSDLPIRAMKNVDSGPEQADGYDEELLKVIAREIAAEASLVIESDPKVLFGDTNILRIVLPAHFAVAEVYKRAPKKGSELSADLGMSGPARFQNNRFTSYDSVDTDKEIDYEAAAAEANKKVELSAENVEIPFNCPDPLMSGSLLPSSATTAQVIAASHRPNKEKVACNVMLRELGDEKASVSVTVLNGFASSQLRPQRKPSTMKQRNYEISIDPNTVFAMPLALPSIMALDAELVQEFFNNILENMQLLYDRNTDKISLCLKE